MEKRMETIKHQTGIIVITGAESTGKTALAKSLASYFGVNWVPELARSYVENLNRPYTYADVENIAKQQINQFTESLKTKPDLLFFDTGLIITKVWFEVVYKKCPDWLLTEIDQMPKFLHLLCHTDLPWKADSVRENGGEMRNKLTEIYTTELVKYGYPFKVVKGIGENRLQNALKLLKE